MAHEDEYLDSYWEGLNEIEPTDDMADDYQESAFEEQFENNDFAHDEWEPGASDIE